MTTENTENKTTPKICKICETRNFLKRQIFVNFVNSAKLQKFVFTKGIFIILIADRPNLRKLLLTNKEKWWFTKISRLRKFVILQ